MYITKVTDYDNLTLCNCTNNDNNDNNMEIILPLFTIIPCGLSLICLVSLMVYTLIKPLFNNKKMEKFLYPIHPVRCIKTGPSECGKSVFLTNLILNIINEYDKIYIYSPSLRQDLYQKLIKCFSNYIPIHIIPNFFIENDIDIVIEEIVNDKDFEKSDTKIQTYESKEELKFPQEYEVGGIIVLDDLNEKEMNDPRVQAMFKISRHNNLSIFIISQDYYELPRRTIRANCYIYHIIEPNKFLNVRSIYQDKTSMDMTLEEFKYLTSTCRNGKYQPLTTDMTKN